MRIPRKPATTLTSHDGKPVDLVMKAFLIRVGERLGYPLSVTQGYNPGGVDASALTHYFGVVDLPDWDWERKVRAWVAEGGWIYHRTEDQGDWPDHLHGGINNHPGMHQQAKDQQKDFWADPPRNGLRSHAIDRSVLDYRGKFKVFDYREAIEPKPTPVQVARGEMVHMVHDAKAAVAALRTLPVEREVARAWRDDLHQCKARIEEMLENGPKR